MDRLFIYGTLGPGKPNENILNQIGGNWEKAYVRGKLFEEGWGAKMGSPGIRLAEDSGMVNGHLFISENLKDHWKELDEFEGEAYKRVKTKSTLEVTGNEVEAFIYVLK
ncbi:MAG: gamma-glutamylcyclotransferase [Cyclobacteriaceae bacterium]